MPAVLPSPDWGEDVTDARMPERWLTDHRVQSLSDGGYRLFGNALMWCVSNRTDGVILDRLLPMIPFANPSYASELVESGVWRRRPDGWLIADFDQTQTGSDELDQLDRIRRADRLKKQRQRAIKATEADIPGTVPGTAQAGQSRKERHARRGSTTDTTDDEFVDFPDPRYPADNYET